MATLVKDKLMKELEERLSKIYKKEIEKREKNNKLMAGLIKSIKETCS